MRHIKQLLLAFILLPLFSSAQSNYKSGYVVTLKGDTLHGFIDYREWENNPVSISFKPTLADKVQKLTTDEINYFNIGNIESYLKFTGSISTDITNISALSTGRDTSFKTGVVFLRVIDKGKNVALYSYTDNIKARYYISETPDYAPTELIYRIYYRGGGESSSGPKTVNENTYLKQLYSLAIKYNIMDDKLSSIFEKSDYTKSDILYIVNKINNKSGKDNINKPEKSNFDLFAGVGADFTSISSQQGSGFSKNGGKGSSSVLPRVVLGFNTYVNPNTRRLAFRAELSVTGSNYNAPFTNKVYPYVAIDYAFDRLNVELNPQVIYNVYNADDLKFFIGAGYDFNYNKYSNGAFKAVDGSNQVLTNSYPFNFSRFTTQLTFKAGTLINKRFEIYVNYLYNTLLTADDYFRLNANSVQLGINYVWGK
jgi:hypothetical protein